MPVYHTINMKSYIILLIFISTPLINHCQEWIRTYGSNQNASGYYVSNHYDKGFLVLGRYNNYHYTWVLKTDINGYERWNIKIGKSTYECAPKNVEMTIDGGFIIGGTITKYDPFQDDAYIMKFNACGQMDWCNVLNYYGQHDMGESVKPTADGGYVLLSLNYGEDPENHIRLFKFDSIGQLIWQKVYTHDSLMFGDAVVSMFADNINFLITGSCYYPNPGEPGGWLRPYYIQTDTSGNETWRLVFSENTGFGYVGEAWATLRDNHGNYYSSGRRSGSPELLKFSGDGLEMDTTDLFPGAIGGNATTISALHDTILVLTAGWTYNGTTSYMGFIKTDTIGSILKVKYLPNPDNSGIKWTTSTVDNKVIAVGTNWIGANSQIIAYKVNSALEYDSIYTRPYTYDSLCPDTIVSYTTDPDCDLVVGIEEPFNDHETVKLKIYPNPAEDKIKVEFPKYLMKENKKNGLNITTIYHQWKSSSLEVFNLNGNKVFGQKIQQIQNSLEIGIASWPSGIYFFRLSYDGQVVAKQEIVVK